VEVDETVDAVVTLLVEDLVAMYAPAPIRTMIIITATMIILLDAARLNELNDIKLDY
jgi:hypothetical protein